MLKSANLVVKIATVLLVLCSVVNVVSAQEMDCYGPGSIAGAVIGTLIVTLALLAVSYFAYKCFVKGKREKHLVLETDPEKGDKYAFDNPCFKDASGVGSGLTPIGKALDKSGTKLLDTGKKWSHWSPLGALVSTKNEKKRTLDDSHIDSGETRVVSLRSHDFTGLGFNICGNMRDGIFIKDVLHRGPASESGKLNPGDRINSIRISFEHMVYEDALTILSYASPYEVEIEARSSSRGNQGPPGSGGQGAEPKHPLYRSSSSSDLVQIGKSARQRLFLQGDNLDLSTATDYSTLQISSNNTTLERGRKSPRSDINSLTKPERIKKSQNTNKSMSAEQLKSQLEQNLSQKISQPSDIDRKPNKIELETQTAEADGNKNRFQKFGVRVLPMDSKNESFQPTGSPKSSEQNDNNINQERQTDNLTEGRDEVDKSKVEEAPLIKRREKNKNGDVKETLETNFERQNSLTSSGIKRDKDGIPQELPDHMLQAAVAARKNRKSSEVIDKSTAETDESEAVKTPKKQKGKAPAPPKSESDSKLNFTDNFDEISTIEEKDTKKEKSLVSNQTNDNISDVKSEKVSDDGKEYCSDSDMETDNQSSVNTIELNSSDITIHHADQEEMKNRKTASTGDLSKIQKAKKPSTGTLERAQSLDITDSGIPTLNKKRKATKDDLDSKLSSDESIYETSGIKTKEPRLSLALDGLDTFQRNRLKKSSEWGNLEDVIMNLDKVENEKVVSEEKIEFTETKSPIKFDFGTKNLNDIQITLVDNHDEEIGEKIKNVIWPNFDEKEKNHTKPQIVDKKDKIVTEKLDISNFKVHNVLWSPDKENTDISDIYKSELETNIGTSTNNVSITNTFSSKTEITDSPEKLTEKPPLPESSFSLKAQFQEKLNSKLNQENKIAIPTKQSENSFFHPGKSSQNFIFAEKYASNNDSDSYGMPSKLYDTNISDDIKVSRHSLGSLERPKSEVLKNVNKLKMQSLISSDQGGISNVTVTETKPDYENGFLSSKSFESKNENDNNADLNSVYDMSTASELYSTALDENIDSPSGIKNITITETILDNKYLINESPSSLTIDTSSDGPDSIKSNTLTFVTEIQVSPDQNVSEVEINEQREETLKKLPEMKFTTSSYETPKTPEKRLSQIELLRSNFERSPPKSAKPVEISPSKSRIPVATKIDLKQSPERREIKIGEIDTEEREIVEIMSSSVHSTPVTNQKFANKNPTRNVTVTSIKTSSKIPSGHYTSSSTTFKPPVPARPDHSEFHDTKVVSSNGNAESSFKQWVFNPSETSVTNIIVNNNKEPHK